MVVRATAEERRDEAGHIGRGGVDVGGTPGQPLALGGGFRAAGPEVVPRRQARVHRFGSDEVGIGHAERFEDVLAEVAVEGLPAHVLDHLAERGESVVAVGEGGTGLDIDAKTRPVSSVMGVFEVMSAAPCP